MISVTKLRSGVTFEYQGKPYRVYDYQHTHLSRGSGTIKVKARDLSSGRLDQLTFKSGENIQDIEVARKTLQYLYGDDEYHYFMDPTSFEQIQIPLAVLGENARFLREGEETYVLFWEGRPLDIDLPPKVTMRVVECAPGEKGNSASNVYKDAVLEGGLKVRVPLFVNVDDMVRVDTRSGEYMERV